MMKMYTGFMRIFYIALCVLIATPHVSSCTWQEQVVKRTGWPLGVLIGSVIGSVIKPYVGPYVVDHTANLGKKYEELEMHEQCPRVMKCIQDICAQRGMSPDIRFAHDESRSESATSVFGRPTIIIPLYRAHTVECALNNQNSPEAPLPASPYRWSTSLYTHEPHLEAAINGFKAVIHHELGHLEHKHSRKTDIGGYFGVGLGGSAILEAAYCFTQKSRPLCASLYGRIAMCAGASIAACFAAVAQFRQYQERQADDAVPATADMKQGMQWLFGLCPDAVKRYVIKNNLQTSPVRRTINSLFRSSHPCATDRLKRFNERYNIRKAERNIIYGSYYHPARMVMKS